MEVIENNKNIKNYFILHFFIDLLIESFKISPNFFKMFYCDNYVNQLLIWLFYKTVFIKVY